MNDIFNYASDVNTVMFADDTNIFLTNKDQVRIVQRTNLALSNLDLWFKRNHFTLNEQKTQNIVIHRRQSRNQINQDVYLGGHVISRMSSVKILGLYIDEHLS